MSAMVIVFSARQEALLRSSAGVACSSNFLRVVAVTTIA